MLVYINRAQIDPATTMAIEDLEITLSRDEIEYDQREDKEDDKLYRARLLQAVLAELPLTPTQN